MVATLPGWSSRLLKVWIAENSVELPSFTNSNGRWRCLIKTRIAETQSIINLYASLSKEE